MVKSHFQFENVLDASTQTGDASVREKQTGSKIGKELSSLLNDLKFVPFNSSSISSSVDIRGIVARCVLHCIALHLYD